MTQYQHRIKCTAINYRQGFIEVTGGIHTSCINLEAWNVDANCELSNVSWVDDELLKDSHVGSNTELELTVDQARNLGKALIAVIQVIRR